MQKKVKGFFEEFRKFITRGNVLDMAIGVIVGGAFTAIVNGLSNNILKPLINWLLAELLNGEGLSGAITMLSPKYDDMGVLLLAESIYIDWGAFISAILNFFLIAFVLFSIIKICNRIAVAREEYFHGEEMTKKRAILRICVEEKVRKKQAKIIYAKRLEEAKAKKAEEEAKAKAEAERLQKEEQERAMANTKLLEEIRDLLKAQSTQGK